jgi:hypothetical protein
MRAAWQPSVYLLRQLQMAIHMQPGVTCMHCMQMHWRKRTWCVLCSRLRLPGSSMFLHHIVVLLSHTECMRTQDRSASEDFRVCYVIIECTFLLL